LKCINHNKIFIKVRVLNYAENIERGPKSLVFSDFPGKVQKSDFPTKRSHFHKKGFQFVTIKKNHFLANFFEVRNFGHAFLCPFLPFPKKFWKTWIFVFFELCKYGIRIIVFHRQYKY